MVRTQIYLTQAEHDGLRAAAGRTGRKQSELIRDAVDRFLDQTGDQRREAVLREAAGMWKDRDDLPDFAAIRRSADRD